MLAATPHLRADFPAVNVYELPERCTMVQEAIDREGMDITVVSAAEMALHWALEAGPQELRLASYNQRGTDLLIETPPTGLFGLEAMLWKLRSKGFRITLA